MITNSDKNDRNSSEPHAFSPISGGERNCAEETNRRLMTLLKLRMAHQRKETKDDVNSDANTKSTQTDFPQNQGGCLPETKTIATQTFEDTNESKVKDETNESEIETRHPILHEVIKGDAIIKNELTLKEETKESSRTKDATDKTKTKKHKSQLLLDDDFGFEVTSQKSPIPEFIKQKRNITKTVKSQLLLDDDVDDDDNNNKKNDMSFKKKGKSQIEWPKKGESELKSVNGVVVLPAGRSFAIDDMRQCLGVTETKPAVIGANKNVSLDDWSWSDSEDDDKITNKNDHSIDNINYDNLNLDDAEIKNYNGDLKNEEIIENKDHLKSESEDLEIPNIGDSVKSDFLLNYKKWLENNLNFGTEIEENQKNPPFLSKSQKYAHARTKVTKDCFVNGSIIFKSDECPQKLPFHHIIKKSLVDLNIKQANNAQKFGWMPLIRSMNLCIISNAKTGKTMTYLPPLLSFVLELEKSSDSVGPSVIVISENREKCSEIYSDSTKLLKNVKNLSELITKPKNGSKNINDSEFLIATPEILFDLFKSNNCSLKKLQYLVLENANILLKEYVKEMGKFLNFLNEMNEKRPDSLLLRVVLTSEVWTMDVQNLVNKLHCSPVLYFGNHFEAALFSKLKIMRKNVKTETKLFHLEDVLNRIYLDERCVVICKRTEMGEMSEYLRTKGVESISMTHFREIEENLSLWNCLKQGEYRVLLCDDEFVGSFREPLKAECLIHYSLPEYMSEFCARFMCLAQNFHKSAEIKDGKSLLSVVFLDKSETGQFFSDFLCDCLIRMCGTNFS